MHLCLLGPDWRTTHVLRKDLVRDTRAAGWRVTIICGPDGERYIAGFEAMGVRCITVSLDRGSTNPIGSLKLLLELVSVLGRVKPDAVLAFTMAPLTLGLLASRVAGVKVRMAMVTGAGYAFTEDRGGRRLMLRIILISLMRQSLRKLKLAIFQNPDDMTLFREAGLIAKDVPILKVNGSGVDLLRFTLAPLPDPVSFVMVGRLIREKGVLEFARAAELVRRRHPDVKFVLVAPADVNPTALQPEDIAAWTDSGIIEHVGFCEDVRPYLKAASVFVLPSYREGTPRAALEALATGRPVITTDVPGCREVVRAGVTGALVPVRDAEALANAMLRMIEQPRALAAMSASARADAEDRFDVLKVNRSVIEAISQVMAA